MFFPLEYMKIVLYVIFSFGLSALLMFLSLNISPKEADAEMVSAYECGFTPLGDARQSFHVRFYVVGILFILFDLEVVFIFPWAIALETLKISSLFACWSMMFFLFLLTLGFIYEWQKGALEWE